MNQYIAGDLVTASATFYNSASIAADPTIVTLKVGRKYTGDSTSTYNAGTTSGPYTITKSSTGNYAANIDTTGFTQAQYWYQWSGTGAVQTVQAGVFAVTTPPLT